MIINTPTLTALAQGFNAAFRQGFGSVTPSWQQVAMVIPSTSDAENYGWMKDLPGMREWIGQRQYNNLETTGATLKNKPWEHTVTVKRTAIEDDKLGIFTLVFQQQGEIVARHPDDLVWGLLPQGFNTRGFDGQYFFDTDHRSFGRDKVEKDWSNVQAGAGAPWFLLDLSRTFMRPLIFQTRKAPEFVSRAAPRDPHVFDFGEYVYGADGRYNAGFGFHQLAFGSKAELNAANYDAGRLALATQFRPDGSPLGVKATHLVVGASNEMRAKAILESSKNADGTDNLNRNTTQLIVSPWLE